MKRVISSKFFDFKEDPRPFNQDDPYDLGADYLEAKRHVDKARNAMAWLQTISENQADVKMFSEYGAQLAKMSGKLQSYLNLRAEESRREG